MKWTEIYKNSHHKWCESKSPAFYHASGGNTMLVKYPKVTGTNGLRRAIINFMDWEGHHLEATNTMGRPIAKYAEKFSIMTGQLHKVHIGIEWQKGSGIPGSSDAKGHINHKGSKFAIPLYVEIKYGKDVMSDEQKEYDLKITSTGGIYLIAKTIDGFFEWYFNFINSEI